jgi:aminotransferase
MAACEALATGRKSVEEMKREYRRRREFVVEELNRLGLECPKPQGTFYVFPCIKNSGLSSMDFCQQLLKKEKVAVVPGVAFGKSGEGFVRISYASSLENLKPALSRMEDFLKMIPRRKR